MSTRDIHEQIKDIYGIEISAEYVVLGVDLDGFKDILGIWIGENESSKFWLGVLNYFKKQRSTGSINLQR